MWGQIQCNPDIREIFMWSQNRACVNIYKLDPDIRDLDIRETGYKRDFIWSQIRACVNIYKLDPDIRDLNIRETGYKRNFLWSQIRACISIYIYQTWI